MSSRTLIIGSIFTGLLLYAGASDAFAGQSVAIAPAFAEATVKRGATFSQKFTITNGTGTRLRFTTSVEDYWNDASNTRVTGRAGTLPHSAAAWVQFSSVEIKVEPGTSSIITVLISVPLTATGGNYAMCFFRGDPVDEVTRDANSSANIAIRLGAPLLLSVEGASVYDVAVLATRVSAPTSNSEFEADLEVINRGDAHARLDGMFAILDASGRLAGRGRVEEKRYFPGQHDTSRIRWAGELAPGAYTIVVSLRYDRAGAQPGSLQVEVPFEVVP